MPKMPHGTMALTQISLANGQEKRPTSMTFARNSATSSRAKRLPSSSISTTRTKSTSRQASAWWAITSTSAPRAATQWASAYAQGERTTAGQPLCSIWTGSTPQMQDQEHSPSIGTKRTSTNSSKKRPRRRRPPSMQRSNSSTRPRLLSRAPRMTCRQSRKQPQALWKISLQRKALSTKRTTRSRASISQANSKR